MSIKSIIDGSFRKWKKADSKEPVKFVEISDVPKTDRQKLNKAIAKFEQKKRGKLNENN